MHWSENNRDMKERQQRFRGGVNGWNWNCPPYQRPRNNEAPSFNNDEINMFGNGIGPPWQWQEIPFNEGMAMGRGRGWMPQETMGRGHWRRGGCNEVWRGWSPGEGFFMGHNQGWAPNFGRGRGRRWPRREDVTNNLRWQSFNDGMSMTQGRQGSQTGGRRGFGFYPRQPRGRGSKSLNEGVDFGLNLSLNEKITTLEGDVDQRDGEGENESILDKNMENSENVEISLVEDSSKTNSVAEIKFSEVNNRYLDAVVLQQTELEFQVQSEVLEFVSKTWEIAKQELEILRMRHSVYGGG